MSSKTGTTLDYCEHDELRAACLECLAMPKKVTPQPSAAPRATKNPTSDSDKISPLGGNLDMSIPVEVIEPLVGCDWLAVRTFPHYLRRGGWVYLRSEAKLQARVKVVKVVWRAERKVPTAAGYVDDGSGLALLVDPSTWDTAVDIALGIHAERQQHGSRYLKTNEDDTITHFRGGKPIPDDEYDDEIEL